MMIARSIEISMAGGEQDMVDAYFLVVSFSFFFL